MSRNPKPCEYCKTTFTPKYPTQRFCGASCSAKWRMSQPGMKERVGAKNRKAPVPRVCEWCGQTFETAWNLRAKNRFCSRSCSSAWRMTQPEILAKVHSPEVAAKRGQSKSEWFKSGTPEALAEIERLRNLRSTDNTETRAKISATLRRKGCRPPQQGGNGRGLTEPQKLLLAALTERLGSGWSAEHDVPVNPRRSDLPSSLKLDIAHVGQKLAIEVDGSSHGLLRVQAADKRKTEFLTARGWRVLRFWNREILSSINTVIQAVASAFTTSK